MRNYLFPTDLTEKQPTDNTDVFQRKSVRSVRSSVLSVGNIDIKFLKAGCKREGPDHPLSRVGDITPGELVNEHEEEEQDPEIITPDPRNKEKQQQQEDPQDKSCPSKEQ